MAKLILGSLVIILLIRCDKDDNQKDYDPCRTPMSDWIVHCIVNSPENGAYVEPANLTLKWIATTANPTYGVSFGTDKDNLPVISQQSGNSLVLKNLDLNTTYYWAVTAINSCNRGCSVGASFTTVPDTNLPYVVTSQAFTHLYTPPRVGGNVLYEGSSKLSERGIYYSLSHNPETGGIKFEMEKGNGLFSDLLPGLNSNTTYYLKAYATNNSGIVFGPEVTLTTGLVSNYKTIKDIDGNIYYTINIATQEWMAENLRTTRFSDGTLIPNITDNYSWGSHETPAYCWYDNNPGFKTTYGALYNWFTVDTASNDKKNICPTGWHVPSNTEWAALINSVGGETVAGIQLKECGDLYWQSWTTTGENSVDFSALASGLRYPTSFNYIRTNAFWWSTSASPGAGNMEIGINQSGAYINKGVHDKRTGLSVRCIKNII